MILIPTTTDELAIKAEARKNTIAGVAAAAIIALLIVAGVTIAILVIFFKKCHNKRVSHLLKHNGNASMQNCTGRFFYLDINNICIN